MFDSYTVDQCGSDQNALIICGETACTKRKSVKTVRITQTGRTGQKIDSPPVFGKCRRVPGNRLCEREYQQDVTQKREREKKSMYDKYRNDYALKLRILCARMLPNS